MMNFMIKVIKKITHLLKEQRTKMYITKSGNKDWQQIHPKI